MKNIVVSTGYMGSGSSAITDLISEFKNFSREHKNFEYVFLHCPNGVFDLEDKLLIGNNAIRSDEAIRTFKEQMTKLYSKKFWWIGNYKKIIGENFMQLTDDYIKSLIQFEYDGFWYTHEEVNTKMFLKLLVRKPLKVLFGKKINFKKILKYSDGMKISLINEKDFYKNSRDYIYKVIETMCNEKENIILDQLLLPFNLHRVDNYFDDKFKVIVVERDPRDVFIINKYIWPERDLTVPLPTDALKFCQYYKQMRESEKKCNSKKVLRIKFEDLVYNYESELSRIKKFLNFSDKDHVNKLKKFNPEISIKNTQLFKDAKYNKEISIIEKNLSDYLYKFPYELNNNVLDTVEFED